ncbi:MAG TPA: hypothetical protein VF021_10550 [Longimicrobiales bacterium]
MKAYLMTTGFIFALVVAAHVVRVFAEGTGLLRDPWWIGLTVLAIALAAWAARLLIGMSRVQPGAGPD